MSRLLFLHAWSLHPRLIGSELPVHIMKSWIMIYFYFYFLKKTKNTFSHNNVPNSPTAALPTRAKTLRLTHPSIHAFIIHPSSHPVLCPILMKRQIVVVGESLLTHAVMLFSVIAELLWLTKKSPEASSPVISECKKIHCFSFLSSKFKLFQQFFFSSYSNTKYKSPGNGNKTFPSCVWDEIVSDKFSWVNQTRTQR